MKKGLIRKGLVFSVIVLLIGMMEEKPTGY